MHSASDYSHSSIAFEYHASAPRCARQPAETGRRSVEHRLLRNLNPFGSILVLAALAAKVQLRTRYQHSNNVHR